MIDPSLLPSSAVPYANDLPVASQPTQAHRNEPNPFLFETDFSAYGYLSPGVLDFLNFSSPRTPLPITPGPEARTGGPEILFSVDQVQRMRQLWRRRRTVPGVRMVRSMWQNVIQHEADNILCWPRTNAQHVIEALSEGRCISRWGVNDKCRERMLKFCKELDEDVQREDLSDLTPHSTPQTSYSESGLGDPMPGSSADGFPTKEVLDASLDIYFQRSPLPFIHKSTFDAGMVPESLLLAIYLVGLSSLYPERSRPFVVRYQKVGLLQICRRILKVAVTHGDTETYALLSQ